jgi:hypothetical protein
VDGKDKELVGNFRNGGWEYRPAGEVVATNVYDFKGELGKVTPYGVYDMAANTGLTVTAGLDDTIYPKGIKITDREMADLEPQHPTRHDFHGDWNYPVSAADQP